MLNRNFRGRGSQGGRGQGRGGQGGRGQGGGRLRPSRQLCLPQLRAQRAARGRAALYRPHLP